MKKSRDFSNIKKGWFEKDGKKFFSKSKLEYNYALYLSFLKERGQIKDWFYEPDKFWFDGIRAGVTNYRPDFKIIENNDSFYYVETKGYLNAKDKTKLKRMKKYHPEIDLRLVMQKDFNKNVKNKINRFCHFI